jgi:hypothetical protein
MLVGILFGGLPGLAGADTEITVSYPDKDGVTFDFSIQDDGDPDEVGFVNGDEDCDSEEVPVNGDYYSYDQPGEYYYIANEDVAGLKFRIAYQEDDDTSGSSGSAEYICAKHNPPGEGSGREASGDPYDYKKRKTVESSQAWEPAGNPEKCSGDPPSSDFQYVCSDPVLESDVRTIGDQSPVIQWRER